MRSIRLALISARVLSLFLCLLAGCGYPGLQAVDTDSGTFSDDLNLSTGKYQRRFLIHIPKAYPNSWFTDVLGQKLRSNALLKHWSDILQWINVA